MLRFPESEKFFDVCAATDAPHPGHPSLRTLSAVEEAIGTHRRSVSGGIGQIGVFLLSNGNTSS
jgi:hypothetical protein